MAKLLLSLQVEQCIATLSIVNKLIFIFLFFKFFSFYSFVKCYGMISGYASSSLFLVAFC